MRVLLTNDDGIYAPGLKVLEGIARQLFDDIWVCAPHDEQSGAGHSMSLSMPVRLRQHGEKRFSVSGSPTDSVIMALRQIMDEPPDLILSGVNRGANLADDITYSGTVSAAMEGALAGVRSIALSQVYPRSTRAADMSFAVAENWGVKTITPLIAMPFPTRTLINVNFPPCLLDEVQGIRVVRQGFHDYARGTVVPGCDPRGHDYYWFGLSGIEHTPSHDTDLEAVEDGFVAVTPLQLDLTHHASLDALAGKYTP